MKKRDFNKAKALWTENKTQITKIDYIEFYKQISYDFNEPLLWLHNKYEGDLEFISLLYIPEKAPFTLWDKDKKSGLYLYIKKIFIMENENLLPSYLRFTKGIIDSNNLSLNISREILQNNKIIQKIKKSNVKKILGLLQWAAKNESNKYDKFWVSFGQILKEGPAEDNAHKEKIAELLRFYSTSSEHKTISLDNYISKMHKNQKHIYYITAENLYAAQNNPQLEIFTKNNVEVLLLYERIDEWMISHLTEYSNISLQSVAKGEIDTKFFQDKKQNIAVENKNYQEMIKKIKALLVDKVENVRLSNRLINSPSCLVVNNYGMSLHLQKIMKEAGRKDTQNTKPTLEINPKHILIKKLKSTDSTEFFQDLSLILYNQAVLTEGGQLENPTQFIKLVNKYII
ncbi:UNVERIFIED_CONTAM: hypothetical protein GTU68_059351 [Idotea baltica]|nr:hypothetical protein [Idotea baltica]